MNNFEKWKPQEPWQGPPLPEFLNIFWPWYKEEEVPPEWPPPPTEADIRVENLIIEPGEVDVGEEVTIGVTAINYGGASGSKRITCTVNGGSSGQTVTLDPGASQMVSFKTTPTKAKTYSVSVNGLTGSFVAETPAPPDIRLSTPTVRRIFADGSHILISTIATNYGGIGLAVIKWGSGADPSQTPYEYCTWYCRWIDRWPEAAVIKEITLHSDESKTVSFVLHPNAPGHYAIWVAVGDRERPIPYDQYNYVEFGSSVGQVPAVRLIPIAQVEAALADP
ncbi:hypothetical protein ES703_91251 [subsurface metagenome]